MRLVKLGVEHLMMDVSPDSLASYSIAIAIRLDGQSGPESAWVDRRRAYLAR
jgi:hypothetical protein